MEGLDVSHHTRISPRGGEKSFFLTSSFYRMSVMASPKKGPSLLTGWVSRSEGRRAETVRDARFSCSLPRISSILYRYSIVECWYSK